MSIKFKCMSFLMLASVAILVSAKDGLAQTNQARENDDVKGLKSQLAELEAFRSEAKKFLVKAQVRLERTKSDFQESADQANNYRNDLQRLRELLKTASATGTVLVQGREYRIEQLETLTQSTIQKLRAVTQNESESQELEKLGHECQKLSHNLEVVTAKQEDIRKKIEQLEVRSKITSKYQPLFHQFSAYESKFSKLMAVLHQTNGSLSLDSILGEDETTEDTLTEIDSLLGNHKRSDINSAEEKLPPKTSTLDRFSRPRFDSRKE